MSEKQSFQNLLDSHPSLSSYICFVKFIRGKRYTREKINRLMNQLVDSADYLTADKSKLLTILTRHSHEENHQRSSVTIRS